ncbi:hypothetical protein [Paenibacillus spongiae]|uniref:Uncharacterized protein n=1 Tax=Paenibacillus spongiae TaxID=2909671 RepID=A0ABY5SI04_9BACL|nr:hypothetical protein [Paenibacillus spongiae]UVI33379.1 hypothetical protein L1F29_16725 [Paenibacillus spongiae]
MINAHVGGHWQRIRMTPKLEPSVGDYEARTADGTAYRIRFNSIQDSGKLKLPGLAQMWKVEIEIRPGSSNVVAGVQAEFPADRGMNCIWKPHLSPSEGMTIGDKVFRSPAIVLEDAARLAALIPDLDHMEKNRIIPHVMDYVQDRHALLYGCSDYTEKGHVYYELTPVPRSLPDNADQLVMKFYFMEWKKCPSVTRDLRPVEQALWALYGGPRMEVVGLPELRELETYASHTYAWAFDRWKDVTWQQFELNGTQVGGVVFIVKATQKPGLGQENVWREPKSLWNQAWFCSLRSAYGYYLWGRNRGRPDWMDKALLALEFALQAPQTDGLFPGYYEAGEDQSWDRGQWIMSPPRRPPGHADFVHLPDSSWTCCWLLKWYRDLKRDRRILDYVEAYVNRLLTLQSENGSFPSWVRPVSGEVSPYLQESPECSLHLMLLCLWNEIRPNRTVLQAAERTASFISERILLTGRWEDFETYWSCASQWEGKQHGELDRRSGLYNQCTFGMYWTAEGFKELYRATSNPVYLNEGERVLAELSLYQQLWEPPYFPVPTLGGFGVMNSDDEWNDARQSLFALTYFDYYALTGNWSYRARGAWAMKASFYMMYCPENPVVKRMFEKVHPHFDEADYGFHMENYNHHDGTAVDGIGEFTIFDWGNGAAAASLAELLFRPDNDKEDSFE